MDCCKFCNVELTEKNWSKWARHKGKAGAWKCCKTCYNIRYKEVSSKAGIRGNPDRMYVNGKYISRTHPLYKPGKYKTSDDLLSSLPTVKKSAEGYVYAFTNPYWFSKGWLKIGKAEDKEQRLGNYQTYTPLRDYYEFHSIKVSNRAKSEKLAHNKIESMEGCIDRKEEWFKFKDTEAINKAVEILNTLSVNLEKVA
jgi:hypothetical protein